jgi:hypothetical protein
MSISREAKTEIHKCRVYKTQDEYLPWITQCKVDSCYSRRGYVTCVTWEEAILEALHHKMRNDL